MTEVAKVVQAITAVAQPAEAVEAVRPQERQRQQLVQAVFRRNVAAIVGFDMSWSLGAPLCMVGTMVPAYLLHLKASMTLVQVVMGAIGLTMFFELFSARACHGRNRVLKNLRIWLGVPVCWLALGILGLVSGPAFSPWLAGSALVGLVSVACTLAYIGGPAYWELTLDATPVARRGLIASLRTFGGGICGLAGSGLAAWLMIGWPAPQSFHLCFVVGGLLMLASCASMLFIRDYGQMGREEVPRPRVRDAFKLVIARRDVLSLLAFHSLVLAALMIGPLVIGYGKSYAGIDASQVWQFTLASYIGIVLLAALVPLLADRHGFRLIAVIEAVVLLVGCMALLAGGPAAPVVLLAYAMISIAGALAANVIIYLGTEMAPQVRPSVLIAVAAILASPPSMALTPLYGRLVDVYQLAGYRASFAIAGALALICLLGFAFLTPEPRKAPARAE